MIEHRLFPDTDARAFTPTASEGDKPGKRGRLVEESSGDWSWKPYRRLVFAGPRCTCTLRQPVGTSCARHTN
jgi:hypothetical protein